MRERERPKLLLFGGIISEAYVVHVHASISNLCVCVCVCVCAGEDVGREEDLDPS